MSTHKIFNTFFGGKTDLLNHSITNLKTMYKSPFQFRNNIFHFNENQHFNYNVGFFLSEFCEIKYLNKI